MKIASGADFENCRHGQHIRLHDMLERRDEGRVAGQLLVPPTISGRERGADEHLVHGRIELHPREALRKGARIAREERRKIGVLEIADPVRHPEMAKIDDRDDIEDLEDAEGLVREAPVIAAWPSQTRWIGGP